MPDIEADLIAFVKKNSPVRRRELELEFVKTKRVAKQTLYDKVGGLVSSGTFLEKYDYAKDGDRVSKRMVPYFSISRKGTEKADRVSLLQSISSLKHTIPPRIIESVYRPVISRNLVPQTGIKAGITNLFSSDNGEFTEILGEIFTQGMPDILSVSILHEGKSVELDSKDLQELPALIGRLREKLGTDDRFALVVECEPVRYPKEKEYEIFVKWVWRAKGKKLNKKLVKIILDDKNKDAWVKKDLRRRALAAQYLELYDEFKNKLSKVLSKFKDGR